MPTSRQHAWKGQSELTERACDLPAHQQSHTASKQASKQRIPLPPPRTTLPRAGQLSLRRRRARPSLFISASWTVYLAHRHSALSVVPLTEPAYIILSSASRRIGPRLALDEPYTTYSTTRARTRYCAHRPSFPTPCHPLQCSKVSHPNNTSNHDTPPSRLPTYPRRVHQSPAGMGEAAPMLPTRSPAHRQT